MSGVRVDELTDTVLVKIYVTQSQARLQQLLARLSTQHPLRGLTVYRAIAGLGTQTVRDPAQLVDPADPPLMLEFYDERERALDTARAIVKLVGARHVIVCPVTVLIDRPA